MTMDLELPGDVAIGELLPLLLELCSAEKMHPQASPKSYAHLQVEGTGASLPLQKTLIDAGISNGTVLVLRTNAFPSPQAENLAPPQVGSRWIQPGIETGGIGVTWDSLI